MHGTMRAIAKGGPTTAAALLGLLLANTGCFAEVWAAANPWSRSTSQLGAEEPLEHEGYTWSLGFSLGMWLDAFGLGLAIAPTALSGTVIHDVDGAGGMITERGLHMRADVDLPTRFMNPWIWPRATVVLDLLGETVLGTAGLDGWVSPAEGYGLYGGYTMTLFNRQAGLTVGPAYSESRSEVARTGGALVISQRTVGFQARLHHTFTPALQFMKFYTPSVIRPGPEAPGYKEQSLNRAENPRGCAFNPHCY